MARACTYQLTRMTDHTWTGCTCVKCSALLGSQRRGRDVRLTWNAWCPVLFCVSITVPNNRRVWRVAVDQTRVTQAVSAQPSVRPSFSLSVFPSCSQPSSVSPLMLSSVFVREAAWESARERRHHHLCLSLSFDLLWRRHKTQGDGEGGRSWEHLHICTTDRHPTGLKAGTTTCARPHRRSANAANSQRLIRESLGLQLVQQSRAADFLEKVWKCPWVPAKMWPSCYALPFLKKKREKKGFLWKMFEPASQKNTMLTDMMGIHYK